VETATWAPGIVPSPDTNTKSDEYTAPLEYRPCEAETNRGVMSAPDTDAMPPLMKCVDPVST
jgi:hypothetical protein